MSFSAVHHCTSCHKISESNAGLPSTHPCRKIQREIIEKERKAYAERLDQNLPRPMERRKLENNIKEFVRQSIKRLVSQQQGQ
jgi:hypothetical protein